MSSSAYSTQLNQASSEFLSGYFSTHERRKKTVAAYRSDLAQFRAFASEELILSALDGSEQGCTFRAFPGVYVLLGRAYVQTGKYKEGIEAMKHANNLSPDDPGIIPYLGWAYAMSGNTKEAKKTLEYLKELETRRYISPCDKAAVYMGLKDREEVFNLLYKAFEEQSDKLVSLKVDPIFRDLRSDERYSKLLKGMNLEP